MGDATTSQGSCPGTLSLGFGHLCYDGKVTPNCSSAASPHIVTILSALHTLAVSGAKTRHVLLCPDQPCGDRADPVPMVLCCVQAPRLRPAVVGAAQTSVALQAARVPSRPPGMGSRLPAVPIPPCPWPVTSGPGLGAPDSAPIPDQRAMGPTRTAASKACLPGRHNQAAERPVAAERVPATLCIPAP